MNQKMKVLSLLLLCLSLWTCKEESYIYEVNEVRVASSNTDKTKEKTKEQYLNIVYANLFQTALSPNKLVQASNVVESIGDKQVAYETILAKFMKEGNVVLPSNASMRADIPKFIIETYERFYVRKPTEAEKTFFVNYIESHPNITPEHIYFSFASSDEYYYY